MQHTDTALVLFSGGQDSTTCLALVTGARTTQASPCAS